MTLSEFKKIAKIILATSKEDMEEGILNIESLPDIYKPTFNSSEISDTQDISTTNKILEPKSTIKNSESPSILFEVWKSDPSNENLSKVITALNPTIQYSLASNGVSGDPLLETKAKVLTARAVKKYDPSYGTTLPTYITSQLRKMIRVVRDLRNPVKLPERKLYEAAELSKAEEDFKDKYNKAPTVEELADFSGLSESKIKDIRKYFIKQISENNFYNKNLSYEDNPSSVDENPAVSSDFSDEALEYVYRDLGERDKKILEYMSGYKGSDILPPKEISRKLNISQSQISRIMLKLANKIYDIKQSLDKVYT